MAYTIKEIAERANVSTATVSRILNGKSNHSSKTVQNVEMVMAEMGISRETRRSGVRTVGLVMQLYRNFLQPNYTSHLISGVIETLFHEGYLVQLLPVTPGHLAVEYLRQVVAQQNLQALVIQEFDRLYTISQELEELDIPVVCIGNTGQLELPYNICSDSFQAGYDAGAYLWSLGHRSFGILSMNTQDVCQQLRLEGFAKAIQDMHGDATNFWRKEYDSVSDSVTAAAVELFNHQQRPDAVFSTNSVIATKFLFELMRLGIRVPQDLSLLSIEEGEELSDLPVPLSAIQQPTRMMGERAALMLVDLLRNREVNRKEVFSCNLVVRKSTASPAAAAAGYATV